MMKKVNTITKELYEQVQAQAAKNAVDPSIFLGCIRMGGLSFEVTGGEKDRVFVNCYALGIDDGYGETEVGHIPYANMGEFDMAVSGTFEDWLSSLNESIDQFVADHPEADRLRVIAEAELGDWD